MESARSMRALRHDLVQTPGSISTRLSPKGKLGYGPSQSPYASEELANALSYQLIRQANAIQARSTARAVEGIEATLKEVYDSKRAAHKFKKHDAKMWTSEVTEMLAVLKQG